MKWIRWQGSITFLAFVAIVAALWFVFIDSFVERMIEKTGTRVNGAKVELGNCDLTLFPGGLTLTRLQVTNPDEPMMNALEIEEITLSLDTFNLLRRKVIIEEMTVRGVQFNTPRKNSGAIKSRPSLAGKEGIGAKVCSEFEFSLPSFKIPNAKDILNKEELLSLKNMESLRADIQSEYNNLNIQLEGLPGTKQFDAYKQRIDKLKSGAKGGIKGILGSAGELKSVYDELKSDLDRIKKAQKEFSEKAASLKTRVARVAEALLEDVRRLKEKYSLSPEALEDVSQKLLGSKLCGWMEKAIAIYEKSKPVLERSTGAQKKGKEEKGPDVIKPLRAKGVDVRFKEHAPLPDFLIRLASVSVELDSGRLVGKVENITPDQDILGIPLTFNFSAEGLKDTKSLGLQGVLNHIDPIRPSDTLNLVVAGYQFKDLALFESDVLRMVLKEGLANLKLDATLIGSKIRVELVAGFQSVKISTALKEDAGPLVDAIVSSLSDIKALNFKADVSGTFEDYDIQLSSDLDTVLKHAVGSLIKEKAALLEGDLRSAIAEKVKSPLGDLKKDLGGFDAIGGGLTDRLNLGDKLLKDTIGTKTPVESIRNRLKLPF